MRDSLIVFVFFAVGVALGYADAVPTWLLDPDLPEKVTPDDEYRRETPGDAEAGDHGGLPAETSEIDDQFAVGTDRNTENEEQGPHGKRYSPLQPGHKRPVAQQIARSDSGKQQQNDTKHSSIDS
jgi:hypothetical protein